MGGKGNNGVWYVTCKNPKCTAYPNDSRRSWRPIKSGPECCSFCSTPFRLPVQSEGGDADDGWLRQNAKGRAKPVSQQQSYAQAAHKTNAADAGAAGKPANAASRSAPAPTSISDEDFAKLCRERFKGEV